MLFARLSSSAATMTAIKCESGSNTTIKSKQYRKSRRVPKPTSSSLSNFHRVSRGEFTDRSSRGGNRTGNRRHRNDESDDGGDEGGGGVEDMETHRDDVTDPCYDPLEDGEVWSETSSLSYRVRVSHLCFESLFQINVKITSTFANIGLDCFLSAKEFKKAEDSGYW